jgi:hypothetical protein
MDFISQVFQWLAHACSSLRNRRRISGCHSRWKRTYIQLLIICPSFLYAGAPFLATQLTGRACVFLFYNFDFAPVKKVCPEKLTPAAVA